MAKNLIIFACLLIFAGCVSAEPYQISGSYKETQIQQDNTKQVSQTTKRKWFRKGNKDYNQTNTYWNFGRPPFWTGTI